MRAIYHVDPDQLPWIPVIDGVSAKPLRFTPEGGWVSQVRIAPGARVPQHRHIGEVQGVVLQGRCRYDENSEWLGPGSYLHERDGTEDEVLGSPDEGAVILFVVSGPRVEYLDESGAIIHVDDQASKVASYESFCADQGVPSQDLWR